MSFEGTFKYNFVLPTFNDGDSVEFYFTYSDSSGTNYREPSDRNYMFTYGGKFVTLTPEINNVPTSYVLSQNYPNPFNGQTKINFVSSGKQSAELIVYDILGQKIRILFNSVPGVGLNTISWDGKNEDGLGVSSGVYYYVLKIGDDYFSKKMVLLK